MKSLEEKRIPDSSEPEVDAENPQSDIFVLKQQLMKFLIAGGKKSIAAFDLPPARIPHPYLGQLFRTNQATFKNQALDLTVKRLSVGELKFASALGSTSNRPCANLIRFDRDGDLFAVGSMSGLVRIFDFLECFHRIQISDSRPVEPIATLQTNKDIADIQWSTIAGDEIAICYKNHPMVDIFDLNKISSPKHTLIVGRDKTGLGGNNVVIFMPDTMKAKSNSSNNSGISKASSKHYKVIVGSASGLLRQWSVPSRREVVDWEMRSDPAASTSAFIPVIGLVTLHTPGHIAAINQIGVVAIYNIFKLEMKTFASTGSPHLLHRICVWESLKPVMNSPFVACMIVLEGTASDCLLISTQAGWACKYWLSARRLELSPLHTAAAIQSKKRPMQEDDGNHEANPLLRAPPCTPSFPTWLNGRYSVQGEYGKSTIRITRIDQMVPVESHNSKADHHTTKINQSASFAPPSGFASIGKTTNENILNDCTPKAPSHFGSVSPKCQLSNVLHKCAELSMTLPGHIIKAEVGSKEITVSTNLEKYLASAPVSTSASDRSHRVYIDWSMANADSFQQIPSSVELEVVPYYHEGRAYYNGYEACVEQIYGHTILLKDTYFGPEITMGYPRGVRLHTNLAPVICSSSSVTSAASIYPATLLSNSYQSNASIQVQRINGVYGYITAPKLIDVHTAVTALEAHPSLPYIIVGYIDDQLQLLCIGSKSDAEDYIIESDICAVIQSALSTG